MLVNTQQQIEIDFEPDDKTAKEPGVSQPTPSHLRDLDKTKQTDKECQ